MKRTKTLKNATSMLIRFMTLIIIGVIPSITPLQIFVIEVIISTFEHLLVDYIVNRRIK